MVFILSSLIVLFTACASAQDGLPDCEWCGASEAPSEISWRTTIADKNEPGEWMTISGRVYENDGETPAEGVILHVYHTNAKGIYEKKGHETGNGRRHGHLRGWMMTNSKGEYEFTTIKPAPYPGGTEPVHIHIVVKKRGQNEYWLDSYVFDDDPLLTKKRRAESGTRGGPGILKLKKNEKGIFEGIRNIYLTK